MKPPFRNVPVERRLRADPAGSRAPWERVPVHTGEVVLSVSGLSKKYCRETPRALRYAAADILREILPRRSPAPLRPSEFLAIEGIDIELAQGEALAVLGVNGAGKTTLLKTIYGLLKPTRGSVRVRGSVGAIIDLGAGLNPLLTGRENILLGASLAGLGGAAARRLTDEVVAFAELEETIDGPLQSYSTGMRARLAYALATHLRPDLLLVDEALAVGDVHFQRKCVDHMQAYVRGGGALLFVSHNVPQIQAVCTRGLLLDSGRPAFVGSAVEAVSRMFEMKRRSTVRGEKPAPEGPVSITSLIAEPAAGAGPRAGEPLRVRLRYVAGEAHGALWGFSIWTEDLATCIVAAHDMRPRLLQPGGGEFSCLVPRLPLVPGRYALRAVVVAQESRYPLARWGWENDPQPLDVAGDADLLSNVAVAMRQLVTTEVEWD